MEIMPKTLTAWLDQPGALSSATRATENDDDDDTPARPQRRRATLTNKNR